jgi:hypothetical protein
MRDWLVVVNWVIIREELRGMKIAAIFSRRDDIEEALVKHG